MKWIWKCKSGSWVLVECERLWHTICCTEFTITLHWHHTRVMASQIADNYTFFQQYIQVDIGENINAPHHWSFTSPSHYIQAISSESLYCYNDSLHCTPTIGPKQTRLLPQNVSCFNTLRPWQMAAIFQTTFSNAFSWMKMIEFRLGFHWSLFLRFELTIFHHWFR